MTFPHSLPAPESAPRPPQFASDFASRFVPAGVPAAIPCPPPPPRKTSRLTANSGGSANLAKTASALTLTLLALTFLPAHHAAAQTRPSFGGATIVDQVYIQRVTVVNLTLPAATSGTPPLTYNLAGVGGATLNLGLTFDAAPDARVLQGTPTSQGTANFAYTVVNSIGIPDTITFRITVLNTFTFESTAFVIRQTYTAGTPVSFTLPAATGGTPPLTYQLTPFSGSLPAGLAFDTTTHVVSGTPTTAQAQAGFSYTVTDSNSLSGSGPNLALTILEAPPVTFGDTTIAPQSYPINAAVSVTLPTATDGYGTLSYAINPTPALPTGLAFDGATRVLSGTAPATPQAAMTYTYTATDMDPAGANAVQLSFTIAITTDPTVAGGGNTVDTATSGGAANGALTIDNPPDGTTPNWRTADADGTYGTLNLNPDGTWTYALDNTRAVTRNLGLADTQVETFTATTTLAEFSLTATITINLNAGAFPDDRPTATALINGVAGASANVDEGEMVTLTGGGDDPEDDAITAYAWAHTTTDGAQPATPITDTDTVDSTFTFMAPEERTTLGFTLIVTANSVTSPALAIEVQVGRTSERTLEKTLAAFGRAFAADAVDVIGDHLVSSGAAATNRFTLGGQEIVRNDAEGHSAGYAPAVIPAHASAAPPVIPTQSYAPAVIPANAGQFCREQNCAQPEGRVSGTIRAIQRGYTDQPDRWGDIWQDDNPSINYLSTRALLEKSAFHYNLSDSGNGNGAPSIWGRATHGNYEGKPDNFTLDGNLSSAYLGMDFRTVERRQAGVAISYTEGRVNYTDALDDSTGNLDAELTSVLPYMRYTTDGGLGLWGLLGYGTGDARLRSDDGDPTATDIEMLLAAAGVRGTWLSPQHQQLAWKASVFAVEMESEAVASQDLPSVDAESQRLRLAIAGRARHEVPGSGGAESAYLAPTWELGLRWDDGDAESGAGADLGLGLQYDNPASGWQVQARGRYLLVHEEGDYEEWSASVEARKNLGNRNRGLALTLTPDWNQRQSSQRVGLDFSGLIDNKWKTDGLRLEVYGERHQRKDDAPGHQIGLSGELRF